jgi:phosphatidylserine decarboxylase
MSEIDGTADDRARLVPEPLDRAITSIQPGGGLCMQLELAWGRWRRFYLKTFRAGYVERMRGLRQGDPAGCPHDVLDPRDLKYHQNLTTCRWPPQHDPFRWRDALPFARVGLAELLILSSGCAAAAALLAWWYWPLALPPLLVLAEIVWFFRNPRRTIPTDPGLLVAPADGTVVALEELEHDDFVGGPALMIGIFLSVFNVHINRMPSSARVIRIRYRPGKFLNALRAASARENEQLALYLQDNQAPYRRMIVRQIAGAIARRIVCWVAPGDELDRGGQFGMIKLGSRTELVIPRDAKLTVRVRIGQKVQAGSTVVAQYRPATTDNVPSREPVE